MEKAGTLEGTYGAAGTLDDVLSTGTGGTSFGGMGVLGMGLSAYGLADSIHSMQKDGVNGDNFTDGFFSMAGLGAGAATFAGGTAASVAAPLLTSFGVGGAIGKAGNNYAKEKGWAGKGDDGENRSYSEMAADWGVAAKDFGGDGLLGDVLGVGATAGGSLVGAGLSLGAFGMMGVDALLDSPSMIDLALQGDDRPTVGDMAQNFGKPSTLDLVQRMQGQGAAAQQQATRGQKK